MKKNNGGLIGKLNRKLAARKVRTNKNKKYNLKHGGFFNNLGKQSWK